MLQQLGAAAQRSSEQLLAIEIACDARARAPSVPSRYIALVCGPAERRNIQSRQLTRGSEGRSYVGAVTAKKLRANGSEAVKLR